MLLYLVQHGKALDETIDPERHLSDEGRKESEKMAMFLSKSLKIVPTAIYHSGKARSTETAEIFARFLEPPKGIVQDNNLKPSSDPTSWLQKLEFMHEDLMLVGHLPHLARLVSLLITRRPDDEIMKFQHSSVVCLERKPEHDNEWIISWYVIPQLL